MARRSIQGCRGILTGASSGIGRALAVELVGQGASLLVVARRKERLEELADSLVGAAGRIEILAGDITDAAARGQAVAQAERLFGGLDVLINNAGMGAIGRFADSPPERLRQVMELNFFAAAELTRVALPLLRAGRRPMVVMVGSVVAYRGIPFYAEYCASKFALQGLGQTLRGELAPLGIDVLAANPGPTTSEFFDHTLGESAAPWPKAQAVPAEVVARQIVAAMRRGRREIVIGMSSKLFSLACRWFPGAVDRVLERYG